MPTASRTAAAAALLAAGALSLAACATGASAEPEATTDPALTFQLRPVQNLYATSPAGCEAAPDPQPAPDTIAIACSLAQDNAYTLGKAALTGSDLAATTIEANPAGSTYFLKFTFTAEGKAKLEEATKPLSRQMAPRNLLAYVINGFAADIEQIDAPLTQGTLSLTFANEQAADEFAQTLPVKPSATVSAKPSASPSKKK